MAHPRALSPTTVLPALALLHDCNAACIGEALQTLRDVYFPRASMRTVPVLRQSLSDAVRAFRPVRNARHAPHDGVPDSGYASPEEDDDQEDKNTIDEDETEDGDEALDILRSDELERGYAIKWLTGLVKRVDAWICAASSLASMEQEVRMTCLEDASRLLARFAGDDAPEEALTRTFVFPFRVPSCPRCCPDDSSPTPPIMVELNDAPVDGTDHTAVGLQSWGSAIVFAERMCSDPGRYLLMLHPCSTRPTAARRPLRLLELGAGTGLLSITAAQVLARTSVQGEIKATDYHPSVLENLARNVSRNHSVVSVSVEKLDWCEVSCANTGVYDVVLAADVVYHPEHARWIRGCVGRTLKKGGVFWLIIPVRTIGRHEGLGETVEEAFPVVSGVRDGDGDRLAIVSREEVERVDGVGRADEDGYTLFEIRWM